MLTIYTYAYHPPPPPQQAYLQLVKASQLQMPEKKLDALNTSMGQQYMSRCKIKKHSYLGYQMAHTQWKSAIGWISSKVFDHRRTGTITIHSASEILQACRAYYEACAHRMDIAFDNVQASIDQVNVYVPKPAVSQDIKNEIASMGLHQYWCAYWIMGLARVCKLSCLTV
jgi:hypothetical protein